MTSTDRTLANVARECAFAHEAEHHAPSGETSFHDVLRGMFGSDLGTVESTAESRRASLPPPNGLVPQPHLQATPAAPHTGVPDTAAVLLEVPPQRHPNAHPTPQLAPGPAPQPHGVFAGQLCPQYLQPYMQWLRQQGQLSPPYLQLGQLMPTAQQCPQSPEQLPAARPPHLYLQQRPPPPQRPLQQWTLQPPLQLSPLPLEHLQHYHQQQQIARPFSQQPWQQAAAQTPPLRQLQQQPQKPPLAAVPPPEGAPSQDWLQETARLLGSPEGGSRNTGLQRLGDMMWGLSTYLDAKGYELPTAFPPPPGDILRPPGPASYLLITRGKATNSRKTSGSWKSGPQPFKVAEGVYLVNVYYNRCCCGKTRVKACEEKGDFYNTVYTYTLAFFEPGATSCSWDIEAERQGVPLPADLKDRGDLIYMSTPKPKPETDLKAKNKNKQYIDMWVSSRVMAYHVTIPKELQHQEQQHGQQTQLPPQQQELLQVQQPASLQQLQQLASAPPHSPVPPPPQPTQTEWPQGQHDFGVHAAAASSSLPPACAPARDRIWAFLRSCQHFGRCRPSSSDGSPATSLVAAAAAPPSATCADGNTACSCTAGAGQAASGCACCEAAAGATTAAELLSRWRALLAAVPPEHLVAMRVDEAWGEELQGQCLAHWLVIPPDRLEEPGRQPEPTDPDEPLPEGLAVQMVQAAIERLGLERWRGLLHVRDVAYHDTPLHRVCRFGHRLQVARLLLQHAPRDALLLASKHRWLTYHSAFRSGHYQTGLEYLQATVQHARKLEAAWGSHAAPCAAPPAAATSDLHAMAPMQRLVYTLGNQFFSERLGEGPSGHQLMVRACKQLGLGEPRVLPTKNWDVAEETEEVCGLMARSLQLEEAGHGQGQAGEGEEQEEAGAPLVSGSKRPRGG